MNKDVRNTYRAVAVVAVVSVALGLIVATTTGHYVGVFLAQLAIASLLGARVTRVRGRAD